MATATAPTTDAVGNYVRDMLGTGFIEASDEDFQSDAIDHVDDSDASNLRLVMASGAVFVVRIIRES